MLKWFSNHAVLGGSGPLNGGTGSSHGSGAALHASPIAQAPPRRSHSNMSSGSAGGGGGVAAAAAAAVAATFDPSEACGAQPHATHAPTLTERVSEPHFRVAGSQRMSTGALGPSEPRSQSNERAADGRRLSHELRMPAGSSAAPVSAEEVPTEVEQSRSD